MNKIFKKLRKNFRLLNFKYIYRIAIECSVHTGLLHNVHALRVGRRFEQMQQFPSRSSASCSPASTTPMGPPFMASMALRVEKTLDVLVLFALVAISGLHSCSLSLQMPTGECCCQRILRMQQTQQRPQYYKRKPKAIYLCAIHDLPFHFCLFFYFHKIKRNVF